MILEAAAWLGEASIEVIIGFEVRVVVLCEVLTDYTQSDEVKPYPGTG